MSKQTLSHNACYAFLHNSIPLSFNNVRFDLGFTSIAHSDVTRIKYRFYGAYGFFWYSLSLDDGHVMNSLPFVDFKNCVGDFQRLCVTMCWDLEDPCGLSDFVARKNNGRS